MKYITIPNQPIQSFLKTVEANKLELAQGFDIRTTLANDTNYLCFAIQNGTRGNYTESVILNWLKELLFQLLDDGLLTTANNSLTLDELNALDLD